MTPRVYAYVRTPDGMNGTIEGKPVNGMVRVGILRKEWKRDTYPEHFNERSPIIYVSYKVDELEEQ